MSEVATAPAPSAPASTGSSESSSSSTASTSTAAPAEGTSEKAPQTQRESSREVLRRQAREALEKAEPKTATEGESSEPEEVDGSEAPREEGAEEGKKVEAKTEPKKAEPEPQDKLRIREALKSIPDRKTREQIADLAFIGKELRDQGIRPADAIAFRDLYPTVETARQAHQVATEAYNLAGSFHSNTPEGHEYFTESLRNSNPAAYTNLEAKIVRDLPQRNPQLFRDVGQRTARNVIANMRKAAEQAQQRGDENRAHEFATAALINEEFLFPNGIQQNAPQRPVNDPVVQENARLKAEFDRMQGERLQAATQYAFTTYNRTVAQEAWNMIAELDSDNVYGDKARQRMTNEVVNNVRNRISNNQHIRLAVDSSLRQGDTNGAANHLISQARPLITTEVANVVKDFADLFEKKQAVREVKHAVVAAKKDVGAPASAPRAPAQRPVDTRGMSSRQALRAMVTKRMGG